MNDSNDIQHAELEGALRMEAKPFQRGDRVRPKDNPTRAFTVEACEKVVVRGRTAFVVYGPGKIRQFADDVELVPFGVCNGCGKKLLAENAWMEDGCPCNSPKGCNSPESPDSSPTYAEMRAERDHANLFTRTVLSSLRWTGDGYEWTGGRYDYRMKPSEAAALTTSEIERLRSEAKEHAAERTMLMTALDGLLNDFIKAVPSSEPIDCNKFTRYQPALLAYVTVRDKKHAPDTKGGAA